MTEPSVCFAGNLTDDPEVRYTEDGIARAMFGVAVSGRREQEASFFTVIVLRDQAEHAAEPSRSRNALACLLRSAGGAFMIRAASLLLPARTSAPSVGRRQRLAGGDLPGHIHQPPGRGPGRLS